MTRNELKDMIASHRRDQDVLLEAKGVTYTRGNVDCLSNFKETASDLGVSPEIVWYVFAKKHFDAIASYCKKGSDVTDIEGLESRVADLINYSHLLLALKHDKEKDESKT